jgi:protein-serine/threonine kinase
MRCSIETVERASAAKIFLETHFNQLLSNGTSPHSCWERCLNHENILIDRNIPCQSSKLRQTRALKSSRGPNKKDKVAAANLEVVRVLGKGSFGVVKLVRKKAHPEIDCEQDNGNWDSNVKARRRSTVDLDKVKRELFAMKVIPKLKNLRNSQEGHLHAERDFLVDSAHSQWVVQLHASFQDDSFLYLIMEFMVGGDFLAVLLREDVLPEATTRWYIAEMILCVEEVHKMKWIHRDLKPDNFLISASGHLKISDFGLAFDGHWSHHQQYYNKTRETLCERLGVEIHGDADDIENDIRASNAQKVAHCINGNGYVANRNSVTGIRAEGHLVIDQLNTECKRSLAKSVVGTSQYMAPEVIRGEHYDGRCDYWSIGVIAYECLYGRTPFYCETRDDTKRKILEHHLHLRFPNQSRYHRPQSANPTLLSPVSEQAINLIARLLTNKEDRLSCRRYRDNDLRGRRNGRVSSRYPYFVHPCDAEDIKSDTWFHNIPWNNIQHSVPPWIPSVKRDQDLAKWFEDEDQILGTSDNIGGEETEPSLGQEKLKSKTPAKRARDKILRDPVSGPVALEVRRRNAFLGYTWHRSDGLSVGFGVGRDESSCFP